MKPRANREERLDLRPGRFITLIKHWFLYTPVGHFARDVARLIWEYRWFSLAIFVVTIGQEFAALWPVNLLGDFIDRLGTGDLGNVVWLFLLASLFYPALLRANVVLRHKMFYETDFKKLVELVLKTSDEGGCAAPQEAGSAYARAANAVSGMTNATYHVLGSFTPVIIKIIIVSGNLLSYNRMLGLVYLASLLIPTVMTVVFNKWLQVLLDTQYSIGSDLSGTAIRTISDQNDLDARERFGEIMRIRKWVLLTLVTKGQLFTYAREAVLVGSQFAVVFMALALRTRIGITPGDFARIIGYTTQVAASFITAASCLDAIISYSRAYKVYATARRPSPKPAEPSASAQS